MKPPIYNGLMKYISKQRIQFTAPGHKGRIRMRADNLCRMDVAALPDTDGILNPNSFIAKSEEEIAGIYGTEKTFYLLGGATCGIYAMLASVCKAGDKVIVDSDCDKSVIDAITILCLIPYFIKRTYNPDFGFNGGINTEELEYMAAQHRDAKAILITSPTYYGVTSNIRKIAEISHSMNMLLLVDEALGAYFSFTKHAPESAIECGADMIVHSAHKTLGAFTGSGLLHLMTKQISIETLRDFISIYQGGAGSTAMLCALENTVYYAFENSKKYDPLFKEIQRGRRLINSDTDIRWYENEYHTTYDVSTLDETRIVLNFDKTSISANDAAKILKERYGIEPEMADHRNIIFSVTLYNTPTEIRKLVNSCLSIAKILSPKTEGDTEPTLEEKTIKKNIHIKVTPYKAFYCEGELVHFENAIGRICRKLICRYPQSMPLIIPGEKITGEHIDQLLDILNHGGCVTGINNRDEIEVLSLSDSFYF